MCLAIPGKIVKIENDIAEIDYGSEKREAKIVDDNAKYKVGDYVIVSAKIVSEKVDEEQVKEWLELLESTQNVGG
jgi:hydrogenase expression/formation protein HypC